VLVVPDLKPHRTTLSTLAALAFPAALALLGTMCTSTPPVASPPPPASPTPADTSSWVLPAVPLARRTILLLRPPPIGPDASGITATAADPTPLVERTQWIYDLRYDKGELYLAGVHTTQLPAPRETPRVMGRFALEIYAGPALLERVRFDFPGLGAYERPQEGKMPLHEPVSFGSKLRTRVGVMLPATARGTRLELWDRATNRRWPLPWPATEMTTDPEDAGVAEPVAPPAQ
jgi:hypothetical protein